MLSRSAWEGIGLLAVVLMLAGVWLNWRRQWLIAEIEEDVKNGKITSDQAWRRNRLVNWFVPAVIALGIGLLMLVMFGLFA